MHSAARHAESERKALQPTSWPRLGNLAASLHDGLLANQGEGR
jgi:hypothetical protein